MDNKFRLLIIFQIVILLFAASGQGLAFDRREKIIEKELNCVAERINKDSQLKWEDVCYSGTFSQQDSKERSNAIKSELDSIEDNYEYGRQREYEKSLEYLSTFIGEAQERPVVYEDAVYDQPIYDEGEQKEFYSPPPSQQTYTREQWRETGKMIETNLEVFYGYRKDKLNWAIAGDSQGANPNIFTEYVFKDIEMSMVKGKANVILGNHLVFDGYAAYGMIHDGQNEVSEYDGNNRSNLAVMTKNQTNEDNAKDFSGALGWRFDIDNEKEIKDYLSFEEMSLTFLLGYSWHEQNLSITDGVTVFDNTSSPSLGPFDGLNSSYNTQWDGPFLGIELEGQLRRLTGLFRTEYHLADYYGWGRLNLRPEFQQPKSFDHTSEGNGWVMNLEVGYQLTNNFSLDLIGDLQLWNTQEGIDRLFAPGGTLIEERQLKGVEWQSYALMVGGTIRFR